MDSATATDSATDTATASDTEFGVETESDTAGSTTYCADADMDGYGDSDPPPGAEAGTD